jgi:hypothetical protein
MRFRKLRIAWSAGCGVVCLLLIALWVRSYKHGDQIWYQTSSAKLGATSFGGRVFFMNRSLVPNAAAFEYVHFDVTKHLLSGEPLWFGSSPLPGIAERYIVPNSLIILLIATLAGVPWIRQWTWRFSLRTLLIATTLVAVVLGLIVWLR